MINKRVKSRALSQKKQGGGEKLSSFAKSIGLAKGKYFCSRCESQSHSVNSEGKCGSCSK